MEAANSDVLVKMKRGGEMSLPAVVAQTRERFVYLTIWKRSLATCGKSSFKLNP